MTIRVKNLVRFKEGKSFRDKLIIFIYYFFQLPPNKVFRLLGLAKKRPNLIGEVYLKNKYGTFFCSNSCEVLGGSSEIYEEQLQNFSLEEGVFIDVGANIGAYTIRFGNKLKQKGRVIAIEPEESNLKFLEKNIKLNSLENVQIVKTLCSDSEEKVPFYLNEGIAGHSMELKSSRKIELKAKRLDTIVKDLKLERIDLIKIDVEGAESLVLKGSTDLLEKFHPKIIFEAWDKNHLNKVKSVLKKFKYKIKQTGEPNNYLAY